MSEQFDSALPQYELGKVETDAGFFKALFHLNAIQSMNCMPAIVESYDRATHTAKVRPLIKYETRVTDGRLSFDRPLYTVPVYQICQGGFLIDAPMFAGDTGLLFSIDRDWATAKKENSKVVLKDRDPKNVGEDDNKGPVVADSDGILSFEYGFFLPCSWASHEFSEDSGVVVRSYEKDDGNNPKKSIEVSINKDKVVVDTGEDKNYIEIGKDEIIVRSEEDSYKISKDGISYDGNKGKVIPIITDVRYDKSTHQIQKKTVDMTVHGTFIVNVGEVSGWTMISGGQAEPLPETSE